MSNKRWSTEESAYLLVCIEQNVKHGLTWNDDLVNIMAAKGFARGQKSLRPKALGLETKFKKQGSKQKLLENGPGCLELDDEMMDAMEAARALYSGDATNAFASSSKHGGATSEAQHAEAGRKSTRKRARDANADEEGASKRKKPNDAAHTQSNKPQTARPAKANRSTRATRRVLREPSEGWIAQSAGAKKEKGKARAVSTPSTQIPDDDNSHRALDLLDTSYTQIRNYLLDMIQNGSPASAARIISLEAQLAAAQAQNAALEAQLNEAHQGNAELTGGSSSPPQILEVQAPSTSSEASENDTTRASLAAAAVQSDLASVDDADSTMSDAFRSDPLATPARPLRDHQDEFGMYFEGDTPDPTILDPTQIQHSPPAAHIDSGEATARAEEFPEDDVDYGNTTTLP